MGPPIQQNPYDNKLLFQNGQQQSISSTIKYSVPLGFTYSGIKFNLGYSSQPKYYIINTKRGHRVIFSWLPQQFNENAFYLANSNATYLPSYLPRSGSQSRQQYSASPVKNTTSYNYYTYLSPGYVDLQQNYVQKLQLDQKKSNPIPQFQNVNHSSVPLSKQSHPAQEQQSSSENPYNQQQRQESQSSQNQKKSNIPQPIPSNKHQKQESRQEDQAIFEKPQSQNPEKKEQSNDRASSEQPEEQKIPVLKLLPFPKLIDQLYEVSWRQRAVQANYRRFIQNKLNEQEIQREYGIRSSQTKNQLRGYINGMLQVRGDGNCFYTAFGYQFLLLLLTKFSNNEYNQFMNEYKDKVKFLINGPNGFQIENEEAQQQVKSFFYDTLEQLKLFPSNEQREQELLRRFQAFEEVDEYVNGMFYGASTIFFRNLANYLVEFSEMKDLLFDRQNLLIWELECNNNEIVIAILAEKLNLQIQVLFFDSGSFKVSNYGNGKHKIMLLLRPGHYNIGLQEEVNQFE